MKVFHYSSRPFQLHPGYEYPRNRHHEKPCGLWVALDDEWPQYAMDQDLIRHKLNYVTEIEIKTTDLLTVTPKYDDPKPDWTWYRFDIMDQRCRGRSRSSFYQGIIVPDFQYDMDLPQWYRSFDCSCACIWDLDAILGVKPSVLTDTNWLEKAGQ